MDQATATQHAIGMHERGETTTPNVEVVRMPTIRSWRSSSCAGQQGDPRDA
jgi:hypothetical protein